MVIIGLIFKLLLGILGRQRKHNKMLLVRVLVWSAYITADSIAKFALGILLNNLTEIHDDPNTRLLDANTQLTAFWAPLLLFHLGGPDTVTAYALEDNELWSRHLFMQE
ncbi:hypothetical protein LWI28_012802 [Acer negundo]|uniref:DUF4220 domain-containing protein n=1 Tax=Acer negundo TaxID=4023 RepID=A0AAD5IHI4_ACENE|nr:hypothetical protein LWI28_012802 [Acer negundo]